jgi:hypothetical protein
MRLNIDFEITEENYRRMLGLIDIAFMLEAITWTDAEYYKELIKKQYK